jgi:hypothetical protein
MTITVDQLKEDLKTIKIRIDEIEDKKDLLKKNIDREHCIFDVLETYRYLLELIERFDRNEARNFSREELFLESLGIDIDKEI